MLGSWHGEPLAYRGLPHRPQLALTTYAQPATIQNASTTTVRHSAQNIYCIRSCLIYIDRILLLTIVHLPDVALAPIGCLRLSTFHQ